MHTMTREEAYNKAVTTWIATFPTEGRLMQFLSEVPADMRSGTELAARGIEAAAMRFLNDWPHPIRPNGHEKFEAALETHLRSQFMWVNADALRTLRGYCAWYAWHEGF
jgi:hypothetical protein